jgi:hypothetical protein
VKFQKTPDFDSEKAKALVKMTDNCAKGIDADAQDR